MMKLISKIVRNNIFLILLLTIGTFLALKNYAPGTFLSGWDTLHPEFNFGLAFEREVNGVFRAEQGLGAVAAHSHMADLPRVVILYILHFIFPTDMLRYLYIFLNLILGPIGMYIFLNRWVIKNKTASFLGSLFYLLNLGTMQIFIVPFEMFTTQYALLPWLFLFAIEYIYSEKKSIGKLLFFSVATVLATPMAYTATLWYVYFFILILYFISLNLFDRSLSVLKKSSILILITLTINSFWILPNLYFTLNHGKAVSEALINRLFSPQAFLYNKEFGNIKDILLIKNFLFDWNVYDGKNNFIPLLLPWINHLNQIPVRLIGFLLAIIAFLGMISGSLKRNKILVSLLLPLSFCLFLLINDNSPTSFLYNFLSGKVPLFREAFRFPDDKVLGIFTFVFALYLAQGQKIILNSLKNKLKIVYLVVSLLIIAYYALPAFKGNLISPFMRVAIPKDYFKMFDWLGKQDKTARVANLPIHSIWGWEYYKWYDNRPSFQGADFLQFGISQPLLNRDFDRWNPLNEQYYREMSQAIYSQDSRKLANVLRKYDISFILLDKNVIAPEQKASPQILFFKEIENLLAQNKDIQRVFNSGNLFVYKINGQKQKIRAIRNPLPIGPASSVFYDDFVYSKYNDYITYSDPNKNTVLYPFRNMVNNENRIPRNFIIPPFQHPGEQYSLLPSVDPTSDCPPSTSENSKGEMEILEGESGKFLRYSSDSGPLCNHYSFPSIPRNQGYLISITSRNISGLPLRLCVNNYISKRCDLFTQLSSFPTLTEETFFLPPMDAGVGFDINFNNFAIKRSPAVNDLSSIKIVPFPYAEISQVEQYNPASNSKDVNIIVSSLSFDEGWKAYQANFQFSTFNFQLANIFPFLFGKELKEHVLVNNWSNGWIIDNNLTIQQFSNKAIAIIFWPQYLEYLGFLILFITFAWIFLVIDKY